MGIIKKQSIAGTIYLYFGVILGFITTGIVFPNVLTTEEVGLLRLLVSVAVMVAQFAGLGFQSPTTRLFPYFRDKQKGHHGFLCLSLTVCLAGYIIFISALLLLRPWVVDTYIDKSPLFVEYFYYLIPLIFFQLVFNALNVYYKVLYNAVKGVILKDIWQRVFILVSVLAYFLGFIDFSKLVALYVISICLPTIMIAVSLVKEGEFKLRWSRGFITRKLAKTLANMSLFGMLNGFSGVLILNVDILMINHFLGLGHTGVYTVTMHFGTLVNIPSRSIKNIASVVIADSWKEDDRRTINEIYKKSSIILTTIGCFILVGLWANIDNIMRIIGSQYEAGTYVILAIGLAHLIDISIGVGKNIIVNSHYYRYLTYFILMFLIMIVAGNLILIPLWGVVGAAFATLVSKFIYNFVIWMFLKTKFDFQPYSHKHLLLVIITIVSYLASAMITELSPWLLDLVVRSSFIAVIFIPLTYLLKISPDINQTIRSLIKKE